MNTDAEGELVVRALYNRLSTPLNGALTVTDEVVRLIDRDAPIYWRNAVFHSNLAAEAAAEIIDRVVEEQRAAGLPLGWYVSPLTQPANTTELLRERGFRLDEVMQAMIARPEDLRLPVHDAGIVVELVEEATLSEWFSVHREGWGLSRELVDPLEREALLRMRTGTEIRARFIARIGGNAVGVANTTTLPGAAHFYGTVVVERYRLRGVYAALFSARVQWLRERRYEYATVHCRPDTSAPICRRYGFRDVCEIECYCLAR